MIGVRGLAKWLTNNQNIDIGFGRDLAAEFAAIFREKAIVIGVLRLCRGALLDRARAHRIRPPRARRRR